MGCGTAEPSFVSLLLTIALSISGAMCVDMLGEEAVLDGYGDKGLLRAKLSDDRSHDQVSFDEVLLGAGLAGRPSSTLVMVASMALEVAFS